MRALAEIALRPDCELTPRAGVLFERASPLAGQGRTLLGEGRGALAWRSIRWPHPRRLCWSLFPSLFWLALGLPPPQELGWEDPLSPLPLMPGRAGAFTRSQGAWAHPPQATHAPSAQQTLLRPLIAARSASFLGDLVHQVKRDAPRPLGPSRPVPPREPLDSSSRGRFEPPHGARRQVPVPAYDRVSREVSAWDPRAELASPSAQGLHPAQEPRPELASPSAQDPRTRVQDPRTRVQDPRARVQEPHRRVAELGVPGADHLRATSIPGAVVGTGDDQQKEAAARSLATTARDPAGTALPSETIPSGAASRSAQTHALSTPPGSPELTSAQPAPPAAQRDTSISSRERSARAALDPSTHAKPERSPATVSAPLTGAHRSESGWREWSPILDLLKTQGPSIGLAAGAPSSFAPPPASGWESALLYRSEFESLKAALAAGSPQQDGEARLSGTWDPALALGAGVHREPLGIAPPSFFLGLPSLRLDPSISNQEYPSGESPHLSSVRPSTPMTQQSPVRVGRDAPRVGGATDPEVVESPATRSPRGPVPLQERTTPGQGVPVAPARVARALVPTMDQERSSELESTVEESVPSARSPVHASLNARIGHSAPHPGLVEQPASRVSFIPPLDLSPSGAESRLVARTAPRTSSHPDPEAPLPESLPALADFAFARSWFSTGGPLLSLLGPAPTLLGAQGPSSRQTAFFLGSPVRASVRALSLFQTFELLIPLAPGDSQPARPRDLVVLDEPRTRTERTPLQGTAAERPVFDGRPLQGSSTPSGHDSPPASKGLSVAAARSRPSGSFTLSEGFLLSALTHAGAVSGVPSTLLVQGSLSGGAFHQHALGRWVLGSVPHPGARRLRLMALYSGELTSPSPRRIETPPIGPQSLDPLAPQATAKLALGHALVAPPLTTGALLPGAAFFYAASPGELSQGTPADGALSSLGASSAHEARPPLGSQGLGHARITGGLRRPLRWRLPALFGQAAPHLIEPRSTSPVTPMDALLPELSLITSSTPHEPTISPQGLARGVPGASTHRATAPPLSRGASMSLLAPKSATRERGPSQAYQAPMIQAGSTKVRAPQISGRLASAPPRPQATPARPAGPERKTESSSGRVSSTSWSAPAHARSGETSHAETPNPPASSGARARQAPRAEQATHSWSLGVPPAGDPSERSSDRLPSQGTAQAASRGAPPKRRTEALTGDEILLILRELVSGNPETQELMMEVGAQLDEILRVENLRRM